MAGEKPGWFRRFRFWIYRYDLEIGFGALVAVVSWNILYIIDTAPDDAFSAYQVIMMICALLILFVVTVIMSNTARARVSAAELLDELRGGDARKQ